MNILTMLRGIYYKTSQNSINQILQCKIGTNNDIVDAQYDDQEISLTENDLDKV